MAMIPKLILDHQNIKYLTKIKHVFVTFVAYTASWMNITLWHRFFTLYSNILISGFCVECQLQLFVKIFYPLDTITKDFFSLNISWIFSIQGFPHFLASWYQVWETCKFERHKTFHSKFIFSHVNIAWPITP